MALLIVSTQVETEENGWDRHTMISKWGQQSELNEETTENNMLSTLYDASKCSFLDKRVIY